MLLSSGDRPETGGGVVVRLGDTKYQITAEIIEIDESDQTLFVKTVDKEAWIYAHEVQKYLTPGDYALDKAMNELDSKKGD
jgi:hypothetical protein